MHGDRVIRHLRLLRLDRSRRAVDLTVQTRHAGDRFKTKGSGSFCKPDQMNLTPYYIMIF
jgi:hypothetical protein